MEEQHEFSLDGVFLFGEVLYNPNLSVYDAYLFSVIKRLDNEKTHCYATNEYLARVLMVSDRQIRRNIRSLEEHGYIEEVSFNGRRRVLRVIPGWQERNLHFVAEYNSEFRTEDSRQTGQIVRADRTDCPGSMDKNVQADRTNCPQDKDVVDRTDMSLGKGLSDLSGSPPENRSPQTDEDLSKGEALDHQPPDVQALAQPAPLLPLRSESDLAKEDRKSRRLRVVYNTKPENGQRKEYGDWSREALLKNWSGEVVLFDYWNQLPNTRKIQFKTKTAYIAFQHLKRALRKLHYQEIRAAFDVYNKLLEEPYTVFTDPDIQRRWAERYYKVGLHQFFHFDKFQVSGITRNKMLERLRGLDGIFEICRLGFDEAKEFFSLVSRIDEEYEEVAEAFFQWWGETFGIEDTTRTRNASKQAAVAYAAFWHKVRERVHLDYLGGADSPKAFFEMYMAPFIEEEIAPNKGQFHILAQAWFYERLESHLTEQGSLLEF